MRKLSLRDGSCQSWSDSTAYILNHHQRCTITLKIPLLEDNKDVSRGFCCCCYFAIINKIIFGKRKNPRTIFLCPYPCPPWPVLSLLQFAKDHFKIPSHCFYEIRWHWYRLVLKTPWIPRNLQLYGVWSGLQKTHLIQLFYLEILRCSVRGWFDSHFLGCI